MSNPYSQASCGCGFSAFKNVWDDLMANGTYPDNADTTLLWSDQEVSAPMSLESQGERLSDQVQFTLCPSHPPEEEKKAARFSKKGRAIEEVVRVLTVWYTERRLGRSPEEAAKIAKVPTKTLYEYSKLVWRGYRNGFDFEQNRRCGMGVLRTFLKERGLL